MDNKFIERLQVVLFEKKWNQSRLAEKTGIDIGTISRWKKKNINPQDGSIHKIVAATGCSLDWLQYGTGTPFPQKKMETLLHQSNRRLAKRNQLTSDKKKRSAHQQKATGRYLKC